VIGTTSSATIVMESWSSAWGEITDGQYQKYFVESGAYFRHNLFGSDPRLLKMVEHLSDDSSPACGSVDTIPLKYMPRTKPPQNIRRRLPSFLAQNYQRLWTGEAGEGKNITHQQKN